jgi:hypothetical protein
VFTVAHKLLHRRLVVLLALVVLAVVFGKCGVPAFGNPHNPVGLWEGPL